jgi:hypothetical protein
MPKRQLVVRQEAEIALRVPPDDRKRAFPDWEVVTVDSPWPHGNEPHADHFQWPLLSVRLEGATVRVRESDPDTLRREPRALVDFNRSGSLV